MYEILTELICVSALLRQKQKRHGLGCLFANDMSSGVGKKHQMHMLTRLQTRVYLGDLLALPGGILNYWSVNWSQVEQQLQNLSYY